MQLTFACLPFSQLSPKELYEWLALRQEVFVVEQNCPYLDCDGQRDFGSWHLLARDESGKLVAGTRLLPKGLSYPDYVSIGRVVNSPSVRGHGVGQKLMEKSIEMTRHLFGPGPIKIGAQKYLRKFYEGLGFEFTGEEYLEDNIPHLKMILP